MTTKKSAGDIAQHLQKHADELERRAPFLRKLADHMQEIERDVDAYIKSHQPKVGRGSRGEWSDLEIAERDLYIFLCHYIDGVTVGQLAETLDINATTVRHTLSSVMGRMQSKVIDYERKLEERKAAGL